MKVCVVSHLFFPDKGDPFNTFELSKRLIKRGHEVNVITWNKSHRASVESLTPGLTVYRLDGLDFASIIGTSEYPFLPSLRKVVSKVAPDVVHIQSHSFPTSIQAIIAAKKLRIPSILAVHGVSARRGLFLNAAQSLYLNSIARYCFNRSSKIICLTKSDTSEVSKYCRCDSQIETIPNGVDTEMFAPGGVIDSKLIIWTGRFVPEKGIETIVDAARVVVQSVPEARFKLVGDGPLKQKIEYMIHNVGLSDKFVLTGAVSRQDVARLLKDPLIFILTSKKEGLPSAMLEAMSAEKAVIAYDIPGVNEVLAHCKNGVLVAPNDFTRLAQEIRRLLEDVKSAEALGKSARTTVEESYNWDNVAGRIEGVYHDAIRISKEKNRL